MPEDIICPECSSKTVIRTSKKGPNVGQSFHVCIRYPDCKGKVENKNHNDTCVLTAGVRSTKTLAYLLKSQKKRKYIKGWTR